MFFFVYIWINKEVDMKKLFLILFVTFVFSWAKSPVQLAKEGACYWPAEKTDKETKEAILKKGCPRYYTEKTNACSVKFSTQKVTEDDEVLQILTADWNVVESTKDGKNKLKGTTKFVVDTRDDEEGLFPYETTVDCKGRVCKVLEQTIVSTIAQMASVFDIHDLSGMGGVWNRKFSIDKESAKYYVNHDVTSEIMQNLMLQALLGGGGKVTLDAMAPVYFNLMMGLSANECPSLKTTSD